MIGRMIMKKVLVIRMVDDYFEIFILNKYLNELLRFKIFKIFYSKKYIYKYIKITNIFNIKIY